MECKSCNGEKPKCEAKDFTKAVVEINEPEQIVLFRKVVVPASLGDDTTYPPKIGKYHNVILYYEANDNIYLYSSDGIPTLVTANVDKLKAALNKEISDREAADAAIEEEIEELRNNPDVVDIVDTYADLQAYDTSKLGDKDIIRVLEDETHDGASTYYRWNKPNSTWDYIGEAGDYYTKTQVDTLLGAKQNTLVAGTNIQIAADGVTISATDTTYSAGTGLDLNDTTFSVDTTAIQEKLTAGSNIQINDNTISATDTTYSDFVGATSSVAGVHGLVPAPTTADVDKVLKGDGTWGDVQPGMTTYFLANSLEDYASSSNSFSIYKDASLTTAVTSLEFNEVATGGPVQLVHSDSTSTEYYRVGFAYDNTDSYQMYDEMSYDIYELRTYTIYSIEDLGNDSFKMQGVGKYELQQKLTAGSNIQISTDGKTISATDTTYSDFGGATSSVAGTAGLVPAPTTSDPDKYLKGDGTWANLPGANNISSNDWSALWQ